MTAALYTSLAAEIPPALSEKHSGALWLIRVRVRVSHRQEAPKRLHIFVSFKLHLTNLRVMYKLLQCLGYVHPAPMHLHVLHGSNLIVFCRQVGAVHAAGKTYTDILCKVRVMHTAEAGGYALHALSGRELHGYSAGVTDDASGKASSCGYGTCSGSCANFIIREVPGWLYGR